VFRQLLRPRGHLFVHRVEGVPPGLYALARDPDKLADYIDSLTTYGAAFYRNLFWEAGMVGGPGALPRGRRGGYSLDWDRLLF
jgi:hypothetical protein